MVHTATLVHDDIIDAAETRRGRPSANTTWGNGKCVLAGDWLYMQAFHIALEERNFRILDLLISLTQQMVEGELLQMETLGRAIDETEYFDLIYRKTACLFQVSMRLGSVLAGATEETEDQLGEYGRSSAWLSRSSTTSSTSPEPKSSSASPSPATSAKAKPPSPSSMP
jgi:octaprenyl-diphosphate synthase